MRATVIVDNIKNNGISGEWGLSIYIEYNGKKILLDTGASNLFVENARKLNISLEDIDIAVLSHAHYDHANGMERFLEINDKAFFYLQESCSENCYAKKWIFHKYIGIPKGILSKYQNRMVYASGDYEISDGISLVPHKTRNLENIGKREGMYQKTPAGWKPDNFAHEQSLVFDTPEGLVIFNSCSHGGAANIINEVAATYPQRKMLAIVGGFHIFHKSESEVREFARKIKDTGIKYVYTGHCTGQKSYEILKEELGDMVRQLKVGLVMEF